jgi:glycosyltransferase involved in cell wall biosynthesis
MNTNVAFHPAGLDACALYRLFLPHLRLPGSIFIYNIDGITLDRVAGCQIVVVQRLYSKRNMAALEEFKRHGMKIVYDLDDDMWSIPSYNPMHKALRQVIPGFNTCAVYSDLITVSTEHLRVMVKKELGRHCPEVAVVENSMDFEWFRPIPEQLRKNRNGKVVIGWAGTPTHSADVEMVFSLIPEILKECPTAEFELVAQEMPEAWKPIADRVRLRGYVPVAEWATAWASWQWDIALAPLEQNKFNLSKSNIKALEAAAIKIPCVMSDVAEYRKFCYHSPVLRKTVLAEYRNDWKNKIKALILDAELRKVVGEEMYRIAYTYYNVFKTAERYKELYSSLV